MLRRFSFNKTFFLKSQFYSQTPRFPVSQISEFAQKAFYEETRKLEEEAAFRVVMENLHRIYIFEEKTKNIRGKLQENFRKISLNAKTPLKDILENYQSKNRYGFDEEILTLTIDYLARTFKSLGSKLITEDSNIEEVHLNPRFGDIVEEIKYGLKEGVVFDFAKISKIFSSLLALEYKDLDLQLLCFEKISRTLKGAKEDFKLDLSDPFKNYQAFKKHYYQNFMDIDEIMQNKEFLAKMNAFLQLESSEETESNNNSNATVAKFAQSRDIITALLENLNGMIAKNESNFKRLIQGIMGIRSQYRKIKKVKDNMESIKENANVHTVFLDLEEKLLNVGMLTIDDIKSANDFEPTEVQELGNVTRIFEEFIKEYYPQTSGFFPILREHERNTQKIEKVEKSEQNKIKIEDYLQKEKDVKMTEIAKTLYALSEIAKLPFLEAKNRDYIAEKWKRLFDHNLPQEVKNILSEHHKTPRDFNCDKLFSPIYLVSLKHFKDLFPEIQKFITQKSSLKELIYLNHAYSNMGLDEKSNYFLNLISTSHVPEVLSYSLADFKAFLHSIINAFGQNPVLVTPLVSYIQENYANFDLETTALSFLALGIYKPNEAPKCLPELFNQFKTCLEGEQTLHRFSLSLANNIYDVKMMISSNQFKIPGVSEENIQSLTKFFAGFEKMNIEGDNVPEKNPILSDFLKLLRKNTENENIYYELQELEFQYLNQNYKPHLFTRKQEKGNESTRNAIFLLDSNQNPLEGPSVKEIWKLRFSFIENMCKNVKCFWIPSNLLYKINDKNQEIKLKGSEELNLLIEQIVNTQKGIDYLASVRKFSKVFATFYEKNKKKLTDFRDNAVVLKITANLSEIFRLSRKLSFITFESLSSHYFEQIKVLLFETNRFARLLSRPMRKKILKLIEKDFDKKFSNFRSFFRFLCKNLTEAAPLQEKSKQIPILFQENQWLGKRLSQELLGEPSESVKNINYEIVDLGFYNDHSYHQYPQWKKLYQQYTDNNLLFVGPRVFSNVLFSSNPQSKVTEMVGAIPEPSKVRNVIKPLSYRLNWEKEFYQVGPQTMKSDDKHDNLAAQCQPKINKEMEFIVNLQNLKYVLKKNMSVDGIGKLLVDFQFIDELIGEHLNGEKGEFEKFGRKLKRKGKDIMKYQNHPFRGTFTNDYTKFMLKAALRRENLKEMVKMRNSLKIYRDYKEGKIDLKTVKNFKNKLDKNIRKQIIEMEAQSAEFSILSTQSKKYIDYEYDKEELLKNIGTNQGGKEHEFDFIKLKGNYQRYLLREKRKAEEKLIKARISKKAHDNLPLSENEKTYLNLWRNGDLQHINPCRTTKRSIGSLSQNDKDILKRISSASFEGCMEFPLNDLILEFSQFFDEKFIQEVEWRFNSQKFNKYWTIDTKALLPCYQNKENGYLLHLYENHLFNVSGELTNDEKDLIVEMVKLLRDKTKVNRTKFADFEKAIRNFAELANPFKNRFSLFHKWISQKEEELKDKVYSVTSYQNQEKETKEVWEKIFQKKYEETNSEDLHSFVQSFVERFYILKKYVPNSFSNLVKYTFQHDKLQNTDRETLLTFLEIFDIEIKLDCKEIESYLQKMTPGKDFIFNESNFNQRVKNASVPFMDNLIGKLTS